MEGRNNSKVIAIVALVVAALGLTVGFAAYTSTLNIAANANVEVTGAEWNVGFADATSGDMADQNNATTVTGTGVTNPGTLSMYKYTLMQGTSATLTASGTASSVSYAFKIKNAGSIAATLKSITSGGITCTYKTTGSARTIEGDSQHQIGEQVTPNSNATIDATTCGNYINATLTIGTGGNAVTYDLEDLSGATYGSTIATGASVDAVLTLSTTTAASSIDGDFTVTLGNTTVVYGSR